MIYIGRAVDGLSCNMHCENLATSLTVQANLLIRRMMMHGSKSLGKLLSSVMIYEIIN